jgi:sodium-dependent dicarboxylate transporter 2/3/5
MSRVGAILAPALFLVILLQPLDGLSVQAHRLAAVFAMVITLWVTEAIPLQATALLGPALAVMMGVAPARDAFAPFADPIIFVFIGSFILAQAIFVHRLNERIAYGVMSLKFVGGSPVRVLVAYGAIAFAISMWISNTATTAMLLPIGMSLLAFMRSEAGIRKEYATSLALMTSYGASLGGAGTPVGTPPNLITIGMIERYAGLRVSFFQWTIIGTVIGLVLMAFVFIYLNLVGPSGVKEIEGCTAIVQDRKRALGPWARAEKNTIAAFLVTVTLWVLPGICSVVLGLNHPATVWVSATFPESVAAMIGAVLLFVLPINRTERSTLTWKEAAKIDWGIVLLFGSGLALGGMAFSTKLAEAVGTGLTNHLPITSPASLTFAAALFGVLIGEMMSHTAAANIATPIIIAVAQAAHVNPVGPAIATCLGTAVGLMFPVSTPPNAIVYASGEVTMTSMIRHGFVVGIVGLIVIPLLVLLLVPLVIG